MNPMIPFIIFQIYQCNPGGWCAQALQQTNAISAKQCETDAARDIPINASATLRCIRTPNQ